MMPSQVKIIQLIALYESGRYAELESRARFLVDQYPDFGFGWKLLGGALQMQGKNALSAFRKAAELMPGEADAHYNLGVALKSLGQPDEAAASYRRALRIKPDYAEAHSNLGNVLKDLGQLDAAVASYRRALQIKPDSADMHNSLGTILKDIGQPDAAVTSYRRALQLKPDYADAHYNLGNVLKELGQLDDAAASYRRATECKPDFALAHNNLGVVLQGLGRLDEAEASFRSAIKLKPDFAQAYSNLGLVMYELEQPDAAAECYRQALKIDPDCIEAMVGAGQLCMEIGEMAEAEAQLRRVLEINPDNLDARCLITRVDKVEADDENLAALVAAEIAARNGVTPIPDKQAISLQFALGKCFDDLGDHDRAFPHYIEGCNLKRASLEYDSEKMTQYCDDIVRVFDRETMERLRGGGNFSRLPIFVLGMPRSGTTLTEQIISSHPEVHGGGELPDLLAISRFGITGTSAAFPHNMHALDQQSLAILAERYIAGIQLRAPDARHITDKMPANVFVIGLLHVMLPNAKIIHVNRNPIDTCLSCYTNLFAGGNQKQTYDMTELGRYYVDYVRIMKHWRSLLPAGVILDVQYEDIVVDQETQARRMIDFCGLEWSDACIDFHKNKRAIRTASVKQVRQPIYKSSVERWRSYEEFLGPLLDALGDLVPK